LHNIQTHGETIPQATKANSCIIHRTNDSTPRQTTQQTAPICAERWLAFAPECVALNSAIIIQQLAHMQLQTKSQQSYRKCRALSSRSGNNNYRQYSTMTYSTQRSTLYSCQLLL